MKTKRPGATLRKLNKELLTNCRDKNKYHSIYNILLTYLIPCIFQISFFIKKVLNQSLAFKCSIWASIHELDRTL